ncbi:hypothetical protein D3C73_1166180 [compost metagenome]
MHGHQGAVGVGVMDEVVHVAANNFVGGIAQQGGAGAVDEDAPATQINPVNAFASGFQQHFQLAAPGGVMG